MRRTRKSDLPDFVFPLLRDYIYLWHEPDAGFFQILGITFKEFLLGIERPLNLLLLQHQTGYHTHDSMCHYDIVVDESDLASLARDNIYGFGDFIWVDFCSEKALNQMSEAEILELLYVKSFRKPLRSPHFPTLGNHFVYIGHDDGWSLRLFVDDVVRLRNILAEAITTKYLAFSGRRSHPIPHKRIAGELLARVLAGEQLLLDFGDVDAVTPHVSIFSSGNRLDPNHASKRVEESELRSNHPADEFGQGPLLPSTERLVVDGDHWQYERLA